MIDPKTCRHSVYVDGYWKLEDNKYAFEDNGPEYERVDGYNKSTTVDVDLHRYKCTQCSHIMYYSQKARQFFEEGIPSPGIKGLE